MKDYTLGFMFSEDSSKVLLILKDRPEWQKGKLNGIGGKWEEGDGVDLGVTQSREFFEETGIKTLKKDWHLFCIIEGTETEDKTGTEKGSGYRIWCYRTFSEKLHTARTMETENPIVIEVDFLKAGLIQTLPNVNWLVPMALHTEGIVLNIKYN